MQMTATSEQYTPAELEAIIRDNYNAERISEVGEENRVIFINLHDTSISIKAPRNGGHPRRVFREALTCAIVSDHADDISLETPKVIGFSEDTPRYLAYHYMPGLNLSLGEVQDLSANEQRQIGRATGSFAASLGRLILP